MGSKHKINTDTILNLGTFHKLAQEAINATPQELESNLEFSKLENIYGSFPFNNHYINGKHFKGSALDIMDVINSRFMTAEDIAHDLGISVRKAQGWLRQSNIKTKDKTHYHSRLHINNLVLIHRIIDDESKHYQKDKHDGLVPKTRKRLGLVRWQAVVGIHSYAYFVLYIYGSHFSRYEKKLRKRYQRHSKEEILKKFVHQSQLLKEAQIQALDGLKAINYHLNDQATLETLKRKLRRISGVTPINWKNRGNLYVPLQYIRSEVVKRFVKEKHQANKKYHDDCHKNPEGDEQYLARLLDDELYKSLW